MYHKKETNYVELLESYEQFCQYIVHRYPFYGYGMWTIVEKATKKVIGRAGLEEREIGEQVYTEIGYVIHPSYRRKGIAFEICQEILRYAKEELYMENIYGFTHADNTPSQNLLKKLGFKFCGDKIHKAERIKMYCYSENAQIDIVETVKMVENDAK